jgi:hypothetical protein
MSLNSPEYIPDTLQTELLDTSGSRPWLRQLNDFENQVFGPDFACDLKAIRPWIDSGCLFYSAVCGEAVPGRRRILSLVSVFITTSASRDRLMAGEIADYELEPWTPTTRNKRPSLYLSAVVSDSPQHLSGMYSSLLADLQSFRTQHSLQFHSAFAISTGPAGLRHMARNGFRPLEDCKYRRRYDFLVIDAGTAAAEFWRQLLTAETVFLKRRTEAANWLAEHESRHLAEDRDQAARANLGGPVPAVTDAVPLPKP